MIRFDRWLPPGSSLRMAQRVALCCLGPVMIVLSFPRLSWSFLVLLAFIPMLYGTTRVGLARATLLGWFGGTVAYAFGCIWAFDAVQVFQDVPAVDAVFPFVLMQVFHGAQFAVFAGVVSWLRDGQVWVPVAATASCWGLLEWGYPKIARWSVADVTIDWPYIPQVADLTGIGGPGFLVTATSVVLFNAVFCPNVALRRRRTHVYVLAGCYATAALYGAIRTRYFERQRPVTSADVAVVQAALPVGDRIPERATARSWRAYATASGAPELVGVDVIFWPETTIRDYLGHGSAYTPQIANLAATLETNLVLGSLDLPVSGTGEFNAAYAFGANGRTQRAHKMRLLPFGEYTPGSDWVPWLGSWQTTGSFLPGTDHPILDVAGMRLASSICFEGVSPGFNNDQLRQGANLLVNLSDDGWFGDSKLPYMHLQAVRWRALEARRWLVRASNSGVSAIIDPTGAVVASLPYGQAGSLRQRVFAEAELTPFVRWGEWFLGVLAGLFALGCARRLRLPGPRRSLAKSDENSL